MDKPWEKKETVEEKQIPSVKGDERPPAQGLSKKVDESYDKVTEAMAGRLESDIPLNDPYWVIKNQEVLKWNLVKDRISGETSAPPPPDEAMSKIVMSEEERLKQEEEAEIKLK